MLGKKMPSKKRKYNARFPAGRIKKIMQTDEEIGKVAQAVPVIISRTLELFVESLLKKSTQITQARNAKTLTPSHMKQCILSESRFDFLKDLVKSIPDASVQEDNENNDLFESYLGQQDDMGDLSDSSKPEQSSSSRTPVIQYGPKASSGPPEKKLNVSLQKVQSFSSDTESPLQIKDDEEEDTNDRAFSIINSKGTPNMDDVPPLIPIAHNLSGQSVCDNLCIDEDYDN